MSGHTAREKAQIIDARMQRIVAEATEWRAMAEREKDPQRRAKLLKLADHDTRRLARRNRRRKVWR